MTPDEAREAIVRLRGRLDAELADVLANLATRITRLEHARAEDLAESARDLMPPRDQVMRALKASADSRRRRRREEP